MKIISPFVEKLKFSIDEIVALPLSYNSYVVLRVGLALNTLLSLMFNSIDTLFPELIEHNEEMYSKMVFGTTNFSMFVYENIILFKILSIGVLLSVISGVYPRITGILHFFVAFIYFRIAIFVDGGDQLTSNITFLLIPMTLVDSNSNHWKRKDDTITSDASKIIFLSFEFLIMIQIAVLYLNSAIDKIPVKEWADGTAIWYWFTHETFGANYFLLDMVKSLLAHPYIIYFLSWGVILLELCIALFLLANKNTFWAKSIFVLGLILHLGIIFIHGIFTFALVMIACLLFYFKIFETKSYVNDRT